MQKDPNKYPLEVKRKFIQYIVDGKISKTELKRLRQKHQTFHADINSGLILYENTIDKIYSDTPVYAANEYVGEDGTREKFEMFKDNQTTFNNWFGISEVEGKLMVSSIMQFKQCPEFLIMEADAKEASHK